MGWIKFPDVKQFAKAWFLLLILDSVFVPRWEIPQQGRLQPQNAQWGSQGQSHCQDSFLWDYKISTEFIIAIKYLVSFGYV